MLNELKSFLFRGDVLAIAVGLIIAGAFKDIIDTLIASVVMPVLGIITGGINLAEDFKFGVGDAQINVGAVIQALISFIAIGVILFFIVRAAGKKTDEIA